MRTIACSCGRVEIELSGEPIATTVCYCDTCQGGSRQVEALPNAARVFESGAGTGYVLYRKDRVAYSKGVDLLRDYKLDDASPTNRAVAACCNTAMLMRFDDAKHWIPVYRARFAGEAPRLDWRICTKYAPENADIPKDVPSASMYPPGLMWKLLASRIAMLLGN